MRYNTCPGDRIRPVFKLGIDKETGCEEVYLVGHEDFQDMIDAAAPSCDLNVIIARIRAGEVDLLNSRPGFYGDVTQMPQTLQELMQTRIDARYMYDNLPEEVRSKIDFEAFMKDAGSQSWLEGLGYTFEFENEVKEDADEEQ